MGGSEQGPGDAWVLKLDAAGAIQWQFAYGGAVDEQMTAEVDPAGGYLLTGYTTSFGAGQEDAWVVKSNATGGIVWQKTYGGSGLDVAFATGESGGGYLLSGYTKSFGSGGEDVWVAKLDATGGIVWQNAYGDAWNDTGVGLRLSTGEILVMAQAEDPQAGTATDDVWFARMSSTGDFGQSCSFITPGAATATTSNGTATTSDATAVSYTVTAATASYSVTAETFTKVPGPFSVSDLCGAGPVCTTDPECNDSNPCTNDACSGGTCSHTNNTATCSDGSTCTTGDVCSGGSCTAGTALNCNDGNACTDDACDPGTGCTHANNTAACNDGNACTTGEACANGTCSGGQAVTCDDGSACTTDSCTPGTGECTHASLNCDDGNSCTADSCDPASGCVHTPLGCGPLQVLTPNGGGTLASGGKGLISWQAPETAATFKLQYTVDNGSTWKTIETGLTGREYLWTVPVQPGNKNKCKVKLIAYNASGAKTGSDASDAVFTIEVIRLVNPNGGASYSSGATETIQWSTKSTKKAVAKVKLSYTTDGGSTWKTIVTLMGNPGSHSWTIPTVSSSKANCKVRVALLDSAGNSLGKDDSDLKFTINP